MVRILMEDPRVDVNQVDQVNNIRSLCNAMSESIIAMVLSRVSLLSLSHVPLDKWKW